MPVSRAAFRDPKLAERARRDYDALRPTTRETFIPFEKAREVLLAFVAELRIPAD